MTFDLLWGSAATGAAFGIWWADRKGGRRAREIADEMFRTLPSGMLRFRMVTKMWGYGLPLYLYGVVRWGVIGLLTGGAPSALVS